MKFDVLLDRLGKDPLFGTESLLDGSVDPQDVQRQLVRWVDAGRIVQLRRGLYALGAPYRKVKPHRFRVANRLVRDSYVSLQTALTYYEVLDEDGETVTSVTTGRPGTWQTPLGRFVYRHVPPSWLIGYEKVQIEPGQQVLLATAEKALLDLLGLTPGGDRTEHLEALDLEGVERLDQDLLLQLAERSGRPKHRRAARRLIALARAEATRLRRDE